MIELSVSEWAGQLPKCKGSKSKQNVDKMPSYKRGPLGIQLWGHKHLINTEKKRKKIVYEMVKLWKSGFHKS